MTVDRIGSIDPIQPGKKATRAETVQKTAGADSVALSSEAIEKGELLQAMNVVSATDDVRADKIAELRMKINDPDYITEAVLNTTADRILSVFGL
jgi:negative regulator of flagellin synthesis FlgM